MVLPVMEVGDGVLVADRPSTENLVNAGRFGNRDPPPGFTTPNIGYMNLDGGDFDRFKGVVKGITGMAVGTGIEDDSFHLSTGPVQDVDQPTFMIGLSSLQGVSQSGGMGPALLFHLIKGGASVDRRVAPAQKVEIRPVK